jgi:hypothetical protein
MISRTIISCSLVGRSWHEASRKHILHSIVIKSPASWQTFVQTLSLNSNLHSYVRRITFTCHFPNQDIPNENVDGLCPNLETLSLNAPYAQLHLLELFPHVRAISISPYKGVQALQTGIIPSTCLRRLRAIGSNAVISRVLDWLDTTPTMESNSFTEAGLTIGLKTGAHRLQHHDRLNRFLCATVVCKT